MCFVIDERGEIPRNKYAWKVVEIGPDGYLRSLHYSAKIWQPGVTARRSHGPTTCGIDYDYLLPLRHLSWRRAEHGIYVFLHEQAARKNLRSFHKTKTFVLMKVHVDAEDFLFRNEISTLRPDHIATYEKVTPCERQPYLTWY